MQTLRFLDAHSGSIQAIASVVLVAVTIVYTVLTRSMAKATRDALQPYVYLDFSFQAGGTLMGVIVGNSGSRAAAQVKVKLVKSTDDELAKLFQPLPMATGIGYLSPGATRKYSLEISHTLWSKDSLPMLDFEVSYHDGGHKITEIQQIDLGGYRSSSPAGGDPLQIIASELRHISTRMSITRPPSRDVKVCPYCGTHIARLARKCPGCLEWISGANGKSGTNTRRARSRLRRQLADCLAACADHSPRGLLVHVWSADSPPRTISLGTGLSRFADHTICSSGPIRLVRECPPQTASDRAIGHATGTVSPVLRFGVT
jgi:hypothetical protein